MGTNPGLSQGQVLTAGQWNALFASKQDNLGYTPLNQGGGTMTGPLITTASIAVAAGFNIPPGAAPSVPNPGDVWNVNGQLFVEGPGAVLGINEYQGIAVWKTPPNPAGTTSGTGVMMGLGAVAGSGCIATPLYSSRLLITFEFNASFSSGTGVANITVYSGTGVAPSNGSGLIGTSYVTRLDTIGTTGAFRSVAATVIITGLTPGTPYWFDLALANTGSGGGTVTVAQVAFAATEI